MIPSSLQLSTTADTYFQYGQITFRSRDENKNCE